MRNTIKIKCKKWNYDGLEENTVKCLDEFGAGTQKSRFHKRDDG